MAIIGMVSLRGRRKAACKSIRSIVLTCILMLYVLLNIAMCKTRIRADVTMKLCLVHISGMGGDG
jgi:hypothetical protein